MWVCAYVRLCSHVYVRAFVGICSCLLWRRRRPSRNRGRKRASYRLPSRHAVTPAHRHPFVPSIVYRPFIPSAIPSCPHTAIPSYRHPSTIPPHRLPSRQTSRHTVYHPVIPSTILLYPHTRTVIPSSRHIVYHSVIPATTVLTRSLARPLVRSSARPLVRLVVCAGRSPPGV